MRSGNLSFKQLGRERFLKLCAGLLLVTGAIALPALGQQAGQKTFASAEEASKALYMAAQANDEKALLELFGPDGKEIVSSGDEAEDAQSRTNFVKRYEEMNRLVKEPDGTVCLYIGPHNWPYPIPIVNKGNVWYFDTQVGKQEILFRRIGRNEVSAIHVCQQLAAAQKEYYAQHNQYAEKIMSDNGKDNGLYWKAGANQPESPVGPLVAKAVAHEDAKSATSETIPYRGYYFHSLIGQGKNAPGGEKKFVVDGKMTGGFAFVAFPAEYRSSGVKTFLVSVDGVVYEKDLGKKTDSIAKSMKEFNPGSGWEKAEVEQQAANGAAAPK
jgi:hypothetical protein